MLPYGLYIKIGLIASLALILSFFYIDYRRLQAKAIDLSKQIENFQSEILIQQEQIQLLENSEYKLFKDFSPWPDMMFINTEI